jgi:pantoate--beta-alanine ligase
VRTVASFEEARDAMDGTVALVPTLGFIHEGHLALVARARSASDTVVLSLFVNPLQFDDPDDLAAYPRAGERDAALAAAHGVDVLFAPRMEEMYPGEPLTRVVVSGISDSMEGAERPGHFEGVATVVAKLLAGLQPDVMFMGRKDAQQLAVVRRMASDLSFPTQVVGVPTVREADGLALSSRNVRIGDRAAALGLSAGLFAAADAAEMGERAADRLEAIVIDTVTGAGAVPGYAILAGAETARPIDALDRPAFLAAAAQVGRARLIDNVFLWPDGTADRGTRLEGRSVLYEEVSP